MAPGASGYADEQGAIQLPKPAAWEEYFPETEYTATDRRWRQSASFFVCLSLVPVSPEDTSSYPQEARHTYFTVPRRCLD